MDQPQTGPSILRDVPPEQKLPNGEVWRNIVTDEKSVVAHSLDEIRGNYKYNWLDEHFRDFHAEVPMFAQWDDHEVADDWAPIGTADMTGYDADGRVDIDGKTGVMKVTLKDVDNRDLWSLDIEPRPDARPGQIMAQHIQLLRDILIAVALRWGPVCGQTKRGSPANSFLSADLLA